MSHADIVNSILAGGRKINRDKWMNDSLQVMANNSLKKSDEKRANLEQSTGEASLDSSHFGYGNKKVQGD
jgi:hypothetical protein